MENELNKNKDGVQRFDLRVYLALASNMTLCGDHNSAIERFKIKEFGEGDKKYPYLYCCRNTSYLADIIREDLYIGINDRDKNKRNCEIELSLLKLQREGLLFATDDKYYMPIYNKYIQIPMYCYEKMVEYFKTSATTIKKQGRDYYVWTIAAIFKHLYFNKDGSRVTSCFLGEKAANGMTETEYLTSQEYLWENIDDFLHHIGLDHVSEPSSIEGHFFTKQHFGFLDSPELTRIREKVEGTRGTWQGAYDGYYKAGGSIKTEKPTSPLEKASMQNAGVVEKTEIIYAEPKEVHECDMELIHDTIDEVFGEKKEFDWTADEVPEIDDVEFEEVVKEVIQSPVIQQSHETGDKVEIDNYQLTESEQSYFDAHNPVQKSSWMTWVTDEQHAETRLCALRRAKIKSAEKRGVNLVINVPIYTAEEEAVRKSADQDMIAKLNADKEQEVAEKKRIAKEQERKRNEMATRVANWHSSEGKNKNSTIEESFD